MGTDSLAFRTARNLIQSYRGEMEDLIERHEEASACRDCEDFLQLGIEAYHWLIRADQAIRGAIYEGKIEYDADLEKTLAALYADWLKPCDYAERWIAATIGRGFAVEHLEEFGKCCEEVRAIVENNADDVSNPVEISMLSPDFGLV